MCARACVSLVTLNYCFVLQTATAVTQVGVAFSEYFFKRKRNNNRDRSLYHAYARLIKKYFTSSLKVSVLYVCIFVCVCVCVCAVSYTHLDVYKRQIWNRNIT